MKQNTAGAPDLAGLRAREYARLDARGDVYLDYTGGALYADSQLREHLALLGGGVFGNSTTGGSGGVGLYGVGAGGS